MEPSDATPNEDVWGNRRPPRRGSCLGIAFTSLLLLVVTGTTGIIAYTRWHTGFDVSWAMDNCHEMERPEAVLRPMLEFIGTPLPSSASVWRAGEKTGDYGWIAVDGPADFWNILVRNAEAKHAAESAWSLKHVDYDPNGTTIVPLWWPAGQRNFKTMVIENPDDLFNRGEFPTNFRIGYDTVSRRVYIWYAKN